MFARNFKNPRAAEPELDAKSLAVLGISPPRRMRTDDSRQADFTCAAYGLIYVYPNF